jgi:hypothetical protein
VRWSSYGSDSLQLRLQLEGCDLVVFPFLFLRWNIPDLWVFPFVTLRDIGGIAWDNEHFSSSQSSSGACSFALSLRSVPTAYLVTVTTDIQRLLDVIGCVSVYPRYLHDVIDSLNSQARDIQNPVLPRIYSFHVWMDVSKAVKPNQATEHKADDLHSRMRWRSILNYTVKAANLEAIDSSHTSSPHVLSSHTKL